MQKKFFIFLIMPLMFFTQVALSASYNSQKSSTVYPSTTVSKQNISDISSKVQKYNASLNNQNDVNKQNSYVFTQDEADKLFQTPVQTNTNNGKNLKTKWTENQKPQKWWREESSLNGWGTYFFNY